MKVLIAGVRSEIQEKVDEYLNGLATVREYANTPRDCLNKLKADDVDVVILGPLIVNKNPGQALGKIRAIASRSSVIYISEEENEDQALELIRLGAAEVLCAEELSAHNLTRTVGRVAERAMASVQMISQISDFVLTHSFDGIVALDLQNRIVLWNHAMERMFGRKRQEILGRVANDVLPFEGLEQEFALAAAGRSFAGERKSYITRGERRYYQPYYSPLHNRSGSIIGVMANFRDLTEGHEKDRMLTDLKARVMQLADTIPGMVWMAGVEGSRDAFNKKWLQFTGSPQESLRFDGWLVGMHPQDRARFHAVYDKALFDRSSFHVEYRMRRHDKMYRRLLDSGTPVFGNDGAFLGFIGSCTDISESGTTQYRIDASAVTRASQDGPSETAFPNVDGSTTMENAPIGVWKLDKDLVVTKASRAVAEQLGVNANELVGQLFHEIVESVPREPFVAVLENEESVQISAHKVDFGEGPLRRSFFWDLAAWPLKDKDNQVIGVCVSTMEVDDRNTLDKQKEDFIATLVHDLKTPLIGADRTLELIINGTLGEVDEGQSEILSMLRRSNQGLLRMVQNLIEVYRFDFSKPNLAFEATSLFDLASECARELMAVADQKNISIEVNLAPSQGDVQVDTLAIRRVILNLLDNAIKFTQSGSIKVWGEETPNQVTIHIKDTGIGIAEEDLQKVFERFWRSEKGKGQAVGTGLGLYLCQQIIDAHQGDINVSSIEGTGTTFSVVLPRH